MRIMWSPQVSVMWYRAIVTYRKLYKIHLHVHDTLTITDIGIRPTCTVDMIHL